VAVGGGTGPQGGLSGGEGNAHLLGSSGVSHHRCRVKSLHQLAQHLQQSEVDRARLGRQKMMEGRRGGATHGAGSKPRRQACWRIGGSQARGRGGGGFGGSGRVVYLVWQDGRWVGGKNLYDLDAI
jgi:hypothetical protein